MSVEKRDMATAKGAVPPTDDETSRVFKNRLRALRKKVSLSFGASRDRGNDQRWDIADDGIGPAHRFALSFFVVCPSCWQVRNVEEIEKKVKEGKSINDQQSSALELKPVTLSLIEEVERLGKAVDEGS